MTNKPDNSPGTPTRTVKASGGGSKKLQQLLGASESDIDLLFYPQSARKMSEWQSF